MPDLAIVKGRLETDGIQCFALDEYTIQAKPGLSDAYGGVKLQVREEDAEKAIRILKEYGYFKEETETPSRFTDSINKFTCKIPMLNKLPLQVRLLAIIFLVLALVMAVAVYKNAG